MITYRSGYKYQLCGSYSVQTAVHPWDTAMLDDIVLHKDGNLFLPKGYAWDGPSGPSIDTKSFMRGSLVHDALYQLMRNGVLNTRWREQADKELRRICLEDGMFAFRAWYVYRAVRLAAGPAASPDNIKPILTAGSD